MVAILSSASYLPTGLLVVLIATTALVVSLGILLAYHWFVHAYNTFAAVIALGAYAAVSFALLSTMATSLLLIA